MKPTLIILSLCLFVLASAGCSFKTKPVAAALHDLGLVIPQSNDRPASLAVQVIAPEWLRDTRIHYRQTYVNPTVVKFYNLDRWIAQPAALLAKHFSSISLKESLIVKVRLLDFEQRFDAPKQAKSVLSFEVEAYKPNIKAPIARKMFYFEHTNTTANALGAVSSFAELTAESVLALSIWLDSMQ